MTKTMSRFGYFLVVAVLLGALALAPPAQSGVATPKGQQQQPSSQESVAEPATDEFTETLVGDLTARGFLVSQGYPMLYPIEACKEYTYPLLKSCFGNNPAAPYVIPVMKSWPDEYIDPATVNAFGATDPGYSVTYRLDPREAIVIYGKMPPPGKYMGLQTWEWSQDGRWKSKDYDHYARIPDFFPMEYLFDTIPPNNPKSGRVWTFSALGDIVNNFVMERKSGYPFGERRYFIITSDATMDHAVRSALQARGVDDSCIFTEQIPPRDDLGPIEPLGMGKNAIDFLTFFRYAVPDPNYQDAAQTWRTTPPLTVLRVRGSRGVAQRYQSLTFEPRTANSEADLAGDLQNLVAAVCERASSTYKLQSTDCTQPPASSFMIDPVRDYGWIGPYCRKIDMNCNGDQQDAAYFFSRPLPLDSGEVYAVVDTLATKTGNATYAALAVMDASILNGVAAILDTDLEGSAIGYAASVENTDKFFVYYFTRHCDAIQNLTDGKCTTITEDMVPLQGNTTALGDPALHGMFMVALRDYIALDTERGPDSTKLLTPIILTFTQP
ncbi:MAG TPA: hypothetical protein VES66_01610 [Terriglobales bacterium]|nr:hypothetical protein [Terriglobales bacterium]